MKWLISPIGGTATLYSIIDIFFNFATSSRIVAATRKLRQIAVVAKSKLTKSAPSSAAKAVPSATISDTEPKTASVAAAASGSGAIEAKANAESSTDTEAAAIVSDSSNPVAEATMEVGEVADTADNRIEAVAVAVASSPAVSPTTSQSVAEQYNVQVDENEMSEV